MAPMSNCGIETKELVLSREFRGSILGTKMYLKP
jgi:hypothetical protein